MLPRRVGLLASRTLSHVIVLGSTAASRGSHAPTSVDLAAASVIAAGSAVLLSDSDLSFQSRLFTAVAESALKANNSLPSVVLYQYEVCPFCCKINRLDINRLFEQIPYRVVEVNPITKAELKWSKYKKVPVIKLGDEQINDSDTIISTLSEKLKEEASGEWFSLSSTVASDGSEEEKKWREWVNQRFVRIITANIYRSVPESWQTFDYIVEHGNFGTLSKMLTRMFGSASMYVIGRRMPAKYKIEGNLREALYSAAEEWMQAVGTKDFLGGKKPNLADLAVFGVVRAVSGTNTYKDLMEKTSIGPWHSRMTNHVGTSCRFSEAEENADASVDMKAS